MFEGGLALGLKGDDDKAHEDVHHEEGNDDDVDEVEECNDRPDKRETVNPLTHGLFCSVKLMAEGHYGPVKLISLYKDQSLPVVVPGPNVYLVGVYGNVQNPRKFS